MPRRIKENIEIICMIVAVSTAVGAMAYKNSQVEGIKSRLENVEKQQDADHDLLREVATDIRWIKDHLN
jgi:hypothetical protein